MNYPLGSFPRFGHQERWAQERRARAIENSVIRRKQNAANHLKAEKAFFNWLLGVADLLSPKNEEGQKTKAQIEKKLWAIKTKLESGARVHFKCLGQLLQTIAINANISPEIHHLDAAALAALAKNIGNEELFKLRFPNLKLQGER